MTARGPVRRVVAHDLGRVVVPVMEHEYEAAVAEGIGKYSIAFRRDDVVLDTEVLLKHNVQYEQAEHGQAGPDRSGAGGGQ